MRVASWMAESVEALLASLYAPLRTATGARETVKGVVAYSDADMIDFCANWLGASFSQDQIIALRKADPDATTLIRMQASEMLDLHLSGKDVPLERKRQHYRRNARKRIGICEEFGGDHLYDDLEALSHRIGIVDVSILDEAKIVAECAATCR